MKITPERLRKIIKEELEKALNELDEPNTDVFTEETDEEFNAAVEKAMERFGWSREHAETVIRSSREREQRDKASGGYKGGDRDERTTPRRYTRNY